MRKQPALAWFAALVLCSGCGGLVRAPRHPMDDRTFAAPILAKQIGIANDSPPALVLLPGDRINIQMSSATITTLQNALIEGAGTVHLPLAGDVAISGLGLVAAEAKLKAALQRYDSLVHVSLSLALLDGHKVTVAGAVRTPGVVLLQPAARLADVIMGSGGIVTNLVNGQMVEGADLANARLVRDGSALPISFQKALAGDRLHNVYVHPGDQINIPSGRGLTVSVMGQTGGQVQQWAPGFRLTQALAMAGGIHTGGDKNDIRIVRGTLDASRVYTTSVRDIVDGKGHDVELYPGDVVWVTDHWLEDLSEVMTMILPIVSLTFSATALVIALNNAALQRQLLRQSTPATPVTPTKAALRSGGFQLAFP